MKIHSWIKWGILAGGIGFLIPSTAQAQESTIKKYFDYAGDYAIAYSGEIGTIYSTFQYSNHPYFVSDEYATGEILFQNAHYPKLQMKIDLHKDQLIALTPQNRHGVVINPAHIKRIRVHGKELTWNNPPAESGLNAGYYILLSDGSKVQLFCRRYFQLMSPTDRIQKYFNESIKYYIVYNNAYYPVRNKRSFYKIFPSLKKQIKECEKSGRTQEYYSKGTTIEYKEYTLIRLAAFCEETLRKSTNP